MRNHLGITILCAAALFVPYARGAEQPGNHRDQPDVDALVTQLNDASARTRFFAAKALAELGSAAKDAVPALMRAIRDRNKSVRAQAAEALGRIGPQAKDAVLCLMGALTDGDRMVRLKAAFALGEIGPAAKSAVLSLARSLRDSDEAVRRKAALALGEIGPAARPAVSALTRALECGDEKMHGCAKWALRRITRWTWKTKEEKKIEILKRRVLKDGGTFRLEGGHWRVETEVSPQFTAELALFMDMFTDTFGRISVFKRPIQVPIKPIVIVYGNRDKFVEVSGGPAGGRTIYESDDSGRLTRFGFCTYVRDEDDRLFSQFHQTTLHHEGAHVLLRRIMWPKVIPMWFNEGIATYFEFWDMRASIRDNMKIRGLRSHRRAALRDHVSELAGKLPRLSALVACREHDEFVPDNMGPQTKLNYMLAESFMDFLVSTPQGRRAFNVIYQRLIDGKGKKPLLTPQEALELEALWHSYIREVLE